MRPFKNVGNYAIMLLILVEFPKALPGVSLVSRVNLTDDGPNYVKFTKPYKNKTAPIIKRG